MITHVRSGISIYQIHFKTVVVADPPVYHHYLIVEYLGLFAWHQRGWISTCSNV